MKLKSFQTEGKSCIILAWTTSITSPSLSFDRADCILTPTSIVSSFISDSFSQPAFF